jgi:hypothetical protein
VRLVSASTPFYAHTFTADDRWNLNHGFNLFFDLRLRKGDGPAQITLTYVERCPSRAAPALPRVTMP